MSLKIDYTKALKQLDELGKIGVNSDNVRTRLALTEDDKKGRDLVLSYMKELALDVRIDRIGNVFAIYNPDAPGKVPDKGKCFMMGSHIDSVINAGHLDGCLGVIGGLAIIRAYKDAGIKPSAPLVVAFFTNEEGVRFQPDMLGSLVYAEPDKLSEHLKSVSIDGKLLEDELKKINYYGDNEPGFIIPKAFIELHIEQGPVLDAEKIQIGVVTGVQGISWHKIEIEGVANHGGTTPTNMRKDASMTAFMVATELRKLSLETGTTLAMVGYINASPGLINVIPDKVNFTVDMREPDKQKFIEAEKYLEDTLNSVTKREGTSYKRESVARFEPVHFDNSLIDAVESAAIKLKLSCRRIVSGAGHDAQMMARICPTSMIFVPSIKGISHNPMEKTESKDIENGLNVLLEVAKIHVGE